MHSIHQLREDSIIAVAFSYAGRYIRCKFHPCQSDGLALIKHCVQVKTWDKVNQGMLKMYRAEVLGKLPVIQHFLFGSLLPWDGPLPPLPSADDEDHTHCGHAHDDLGPAALREVGWGDCCGIPVPSIFGAAKAEHAGKLPGLKLSGPNIRPVPFD